MGGLSVSTFVISESIEPVEIPSDYDFEYDISLSDETISGKYGDVEFTDGKASFTLRYGGKSKQIKNLPIGTAWTITETNANQDGYSVVEETQSGKISEPVLHMVQFSHIYTKPEVAKLTIIGDRRDSDTDSYYSSDVFPFFMTMCTADKKVDTSFTGQFGVFNFVNGKMLEPVYLEYSKEYSLNIPPERYVTCGINPSVQNIAGATWTSTATKVDLNATKLSQKDGEYFIKFLVDTSHGGSVSYTKNIINDDDANNDKDWYFTLDISDVNEHINFISNDDFNFEKNGNVWKCKFSLKNDETKTFTFPNNTRIKITEENPEGYTPSFVHTLLGWDYSDWTSNAIQTSITVKNTKNASGASLGTAERGSLKGGSVSSKDVVDDKTVSDTTQSSNSFTFVVGEEPADDTEN